jgi:uncharacterized protein YcfJ
MKTIAKFFATAILAGAAALPSVSAQSMTRMADKPSVTQSSDVTDIRWRRECNRNRCRNVWTGPHRYRPQVIVRPRAYIQPRVVIRPGVVVRSGYNRHDSWCLSRYRSYNPATNRYLGYDGTYKRCNSPYR